MVLEHNAYLVLPRLRMQNLNAISSPMTWGAPSITAAIGFMQALQRILPPEWKIVLTKVGMVIHEFQPQISGSYVRKFNLTRNPLGYDGKPLGIIEEGRAHATVSLVFGAHFMGDPADDERLQVRAWDIYQVASNMRFAGGLIIHQDNNWHSPQLLILAEDENAHRRHAQLKRSLLPGFALISRDDVLLAHSAKLHAQNPALTVFDAWLDLSRINKRCIVTETVQKNDEVKEVVEWLSEREKGSGWLVPIAVGYSALSKVYAGGEVHNARDPNLPFRFVESMYSIGEWRSPHRLTSLNEILWYPSTEHEAGIYRCMNNNSVQDAASRSQSDV